MIKRTLMILIAAGTIASAQNYSGQRVGPYQFWHGSDGRADEHQEESGAQFSHGHDGYGRSFNGSGQRKWVITSSGAIVGTILTTKTDCF